jgi:hypothetical protein
MSVMRYYKPYMPAPFLLPDDWVQKSNWSGQPENGTIDLIRLALLDRINWMAYYKSFRDDTVLDKDRITQRYFMLICTIRQLARTIEMVSVEPI